MCRRKPLAKEDDEAKLRRQGIHQVEDKRYHYISGPFGTRTVCFQKKMLKTKDIITYRDFLAVELFVSKKDCEGGKESRGLLHL